MIFSLKTGLSDLLQIIDVFAIGAETLNFAVVCDLLCFQSLVLSNTACVSATLPITRHTLEKTRATTSVDLKTLIIEIKILLKTRFDELIFEISDDATFIITAKRDTRQVYESVINVVNNNNGEDVSRYMNSAKHDDDVAIGRSVSGDDYLEKHLGVSPIKAIQTLDFDFNIKLCGEEFEQFKRLISMTIINKTCELILSISNNCLHTTRTSTLSKTKLSMMLQKNLKNKSFNATFGAQIARLISKVISLYPSSNGQSNKKTSSKKRKREEDAGEEEDEEEKKQQLSSDIPSEFPSEFHSEIPPMCMKLSNQLPLFIRVPMNNKVVLNVLAGSKVGSQDDDDDDDNDNDDQEDQDQEDEL